MQRDPFVEDITNEGIIVKGEEKAYGIFFEPEEKVVEREIKRKLTKTPEEFAAQEQDSTQEEGGKTLTRYFIRKALLNKQGGECPDCLERKKLRLVRVNKNGDKPGVSDYILLCDPCIKKRKEEQKKTKLWSRKPGVRGGSPGNSKISFFNSIRPLVFERDGKECVWCGAKEALGLGPLIPPSRGKKLCFDNYVVTCQKCRPAKGNKLPLEYIWDEISFKYWLTEQLTDEPVVKNPGARASVNMHLIAEIQQYLHRIAGGVEIDRSKAERLAIRLSETDEDRKREREQALW